MKREITVKNIFSNIPVDRDKEIFELLIDNSQLRLERIISKGHASPKNFWYDQEKNEFVLLLSGNAVILFDDGKKIELKAGDYFIIPSHKKHRVDYTNPNENTIWLALYY